MGIAGCVFCLWLSAPVAVSIDNPPDRFQDGLQGPVKTVEWRVQEMDKKQDEILWRPAYLWKRVFYDESGNKTEEQRFDENGNQVDSISYKPSSNKKRIVQEWTDKTGGKTYFHQEFDDHGKILREKYLDASRRLIRQWVYEWHPGEKYDLVFVYEADGKRTGQGRWYYDSRWRVIRKTGTGMDVTYAYDDQGRLSRSEQKQANGTWIIEYQEGREIKKTVSLTEGTSWTAIFRYEDDERGNWIRQTEVILSPPGQTPPENEVRRVFRTVEYYP
ncbi:MAG: hypothetical protein ACE15F_07390 [bacterium]